MSIGESYSWRHARNQFEYKLRDRWKLLKFGWASASNAAISVKLMVLGMYSETSLKHRWLCTRYLDGYRQYLLYISSGYLLLLAIFGTKFEIFWEPKHPLGFTIHITYWAPSILLRSMHYGLTNPKRFLVHISQPFPPALRCNWNSDAGTVKSNHKTKVFIFSV